MTRPEDIPADVWVMARALLGEPDASTRPATIDRIARALLAYGHRRADEAMERAAMVADEGVQLAEQLADISAHPEFAKQFRIYKRILAAMATSIRSSK